MSAFVDVPATELAGQALDWAVAKVEGRDIRPGRWRGKLSSNHGIWQPSTDWRQGAPLADKYGISTILMGFPKQWHALIDVGFDAGNNIYGLWEATGDTLLIAICRVLIAAKLGPVVSIPAELVPAVQP